MPRHSWPPSLAAVVRAVILGLPPADRAALGRIGEGEGFELYDADEPGWAYKDGDAGGDPPTIRLRADLAELYGEDGAAFVVAHECAHIRHRHSALLGANPRLRPQLERHANEQAIRWLGPAALEWFHFFAELDRD